MAPSTRVSLGPNAQAVAERILEGEPLTAGVAQELVRSVQKDGGVPKGVTDSYLSGVLTDLYEAGQKSGTFVGRLTVMELRHAVQQRRICETLTAGASQEGEKMSVLARLFRAPAPTPAGYVALSAKDAEAVIAAGREAGLRLQILAEAQAYPGSHVRISGRFYFQPRVESELRSLLRRGGADDADLGGVRALLERTFRGTSLEQVAKLDEEFASSLAKAGDELAQSIHAQEARERLQAMSEKVER